jgi:hypothetical protein
MIWTARGEVSIEELSIGDSVVTHSGKHNGTCCPRNHARLC